MTNEIKKQILDDYNNHEIKVHDIYAKYHISGNQLGAIITEMGGQYRHPNKTGSKNKKIKICPKCHRKIEIKGAKFCCFCGSDIREEKDLIIEKLQSIYANIILLPAEIRDETQATVTAAIEYIKKGDNK